jgi:transcriptional regulator with XRE-family HTH domain
LLHIFVIVNHVREGARMSVGQNIRRYGAERELTQEQLAALIGNKRITITRDKLDALDIPLNVLVAIAQALKVPLSQLFNGDQRVPSV